MKVYQTNEIKNIALLGNDGSGKTTLTEALLFESGIIKRQKKYIGFHSYFYCGIGFILGTLIHSLFTWRFGVTHFIFFFIAMFEIVYALIQMHRYRSYAPLKVRKTVGKKKIRGSDLFTIVLCTLIAILAIYKFGFY